MLITYAEKLKNIVDGWKNYSFPSDQVEAVAKERASICSTCVNAVHSEFVDFLDFKAVEMKGMVCDKCKCPITKAVRAMNYSCPIYKWDAVNK